LYVEDLLPKGLLAGSKQLRKIYKNLTFKNILFISLQSPFEVHNDRTYGQIYSTVVKKDDIPEEILNELPGWQDMKVTATIDKDGTTYGGNFRGYFDKNRNSEFNTILKTIGVQLELFVITGGSKKYDPFLVVQSGKVQKMKYGEKIKDTDSEAESNYLKSLGMIIDIPELKLPLLDKFMKLENIAVGIKSSIYELEPWKSLPAAFKEKKSKSDMDVFLTAESTIQIEDYKHKGAVLLDLGQSEEQDTFTMISFNKDEDIFSNLKLNKLSFLKNSKISSTAAYKIEIAQNKNDEKKDKISLSAVGKAEVGSKEIDLTAKFELNNDGAYLDFIDIHDNLTLADFSHNIPKADEFALSELKIYPPFNPKTEPGIEAKTKFFNIENDLFLFEHNGNDVLAVDVSAKGNQTFNLSLLTNKIKEGVLPTTVTDNLSGFGVANGAVIFSDEDLNINFSNLKDGIAKDLFIKIFGKQTAPLKLNKTTFISDFNVDLAGKIGSLLKNGIGGAKISLSDNTYILGSVDGIFGEDPFKLDLEFIGDQQYNASSIKLPGAFKSLKSSSKEGIFLKVIEGSAEIAISSGFGLSINGSEIEFDGSIGVDINDDDLGISLTGSTEDNIDNFAGIKHFKVTGAKLNAVIGNDIKAGLEVDTSFLGRNMTTSSDLVFDTKGYPKGLGFETYTNKLDKDGWKLVNYSAILTTPTIALGGIGAVAGGGALGIIGAIAGNPEGDAGGAAAGAPFAGVGAAPGAVIGGLVSSAIVGGAGVAVGVIAGGAAGAAGGFAIGAIGDAVVGNTTAGKTGMDKLTLLEANILKADNVYLSFATENAASAELSIPEGIHFNMENVQLFDKAKHDHRPDFTGIYNLANEITKDIDKTENFLKKMRDDFKDAEKRLEKKVKEKEAEYKKKFKKNWKEELHKDAIKTFKFTKEEIEKAKKYAKIIAKIYNKVMSVVHYELGLVKEVPKDVEYKLTKELKTSISHLKEFMNGAHIENESFGPIKIPTAKIVLVPSFSASGEVKLFDEFDETIDIKFNDDNKLMFKSDFEIKELGTIQNEFILQSKNEVEVLGDLPSTEKFESWLENKIKSDAFSLIDDSADKYDNLKDDIAKLEKDIEDLGREIENEAKKALSYIENSKEVQYAEKAWHKAKSDYEHAVNKCKSYKTCLCCGRACAHPCKDVYDAIKGSVDKVVATVNSFGHHLHIPHITNPEHKEHAYKDAKKNVDVSTFNAKVEEYKSDKADKASELHSKRSQIISTFNNFHKSSPEELMDRVKSIINRINIASVFEIKELAYAGTLHPVKPRETVYLMKIDYKLFGKESTDYVLFKPFDMQFNEASFALFSLTAFEYILKNHGEHMLYSSFHDNGLLKRMSKAGDRELAHKVILWIMKNTNDKIQDLQAFMEKNISKKDELRYEKAIDSFVNSIKGIDAASNEYENLLLKNVQDTNPVDLMSPSKSFNNRYIAVAHSTLCLGVAPNGIDVIQENCKDVRSERWSAEKLTNKDKSPTGFVQLKSNGLCLKASTKDNKESGLPLKLSKCDKNDEHGQWKIVSKDGIFDMIVNRYSQKCLHFDTVNTNPRTAYAVWRSCLSIDSQGFRDIKDAQRPSWHDTKQLITAKNGSCLTAKDGYDDYFRKTEKGHTTATKDIFEQMKRKKDDILLASRCKKDETNEFNFLELVNGDIKLVHDKTGWCVAPKSKNSNKLALKPCNKGTYMFWDPIEVGGAVILKNKEANKCMSLQKLRAGNPFSEAILENCTKSDAQKIDFSN